MSENKNSVERDCGPVRDLLPLYVENIENEGSRRFIEEHLSRCPDCRAEAERLRAGQFAAPDGAMPLKRLRRAVMKRRLTLVLLAAAFIALLAAAVFARLTKRHYLPYAEAVSAAGGETGSLYFSFTGKVTGFETSSSDDTVLGVPVVCYNVQAWYTLADRLRGGERPQCCSVAVPPASSLSGKTGEEVITDPFLAARVESGEQPAPAGSIFTDISAGSGFGEVCTVQSGRVELKYDISPSASRLPFLVLIGALALTAAALIVFALLLIKRKKHAAKAAFLIMLLPLSFAAAFLLANGWELYSHTPAHDLLTALAAGVPVYAVFACLHGLWSMNRGGTV